MSRALDRYIASVYQTGLTMPDRDYDLSMDARNVELLVDYQPDGLSLRVTDDGAGFDTDGRHDGFGLLGMRERAERIGATLHVSSAAGRGTRVLMHLASHGGAER